MQLIIEVVLPGWLLSDIVIWTHDGAIVRSDIQPMKGLGIYFVIARKSRKSKKPKEGRKAQAWVN